MSCSSDFFYDHSRQNFIVFPARFLQTFFECVLHTSTRKLKRKKTLFNPFFCSFLFIQTFIFMNVNDWFMTPILVFFSVSFSVSWRQTRVVSESAGSLYEWLSYLAFVFHSTLFVPLTTDNGNKISPKLMTSYRLWTIGRAQTHKLCSRVLYVYSSKGL